MTQQTSIATRKVPIEVFMEMTGKDAEAVRRLWRKHPLLKAKVQGEKAARVNLDVWERILKHA